MALDDHELEVAETLYRAWQARKHRDCFKRQLCRAADALRTLGQAVQSELDGGDQRATLRERRL